ncbi:prohibitin family protein [bacterium]|nr:prohibitin family protein [candidate division CSSED10-310 bacterium]
MRRTRWLIVVLVLVAGIGCTKIQPQEGGVRTNFIIAKGISDKSLGPGLYLNIPSVTEVEAYSIKEAKYEMTKSPTGGDEQGRDDVQLKSKDGQVVWVDVTVRYRLISDRLPILHRIYGKDYLTSAIRPMARALTSYKFGDLSAEEIYEGSNREKLGLQIRAMMNDGYENQEGLRIKGIEVLDVLFRSFEFTEDYQNAIETKRLATEQKLAAVELAKKKEAEAEGDKLAVIKRAEGAADARKKEAAAELYAQQQQALGILAIGNAEAEAKDAMARALGGGDVLVRLEFARKLGENMQVWGIPIGGDSTSIMDLSGLFGGMFPRMSQGVTPVEAPVAD